MQEIWNQADGILLLWIQRVFVHPFLTPIMKYITHTGDGAHIWIVIAILFLFIKKSRKTGILMCISLITSYFIQNRWLKPLVHRMRPYEMSNSIKLLIEKQSDFSFPSGHAGSAFAAAVIIYLTLPKPIGRAALIYAGLIAFTRLYLGVHYPSDVIAGILIASIVAFSVVKLERYLFQQNSLQL